MAFRQSAIVVVAPSDPDRSAQAGANPTAGPTCSFQHPHLVDASIRRGDLPPAAWLDRYGRCRSRLKRTRMSVCTMETSTTAPDSNRPTFRAALMAALRFQIELDVLSVPHRLRIRRTWRSERPRSWPASRVTRAPASNWFEDHELGVAHWRSKRSCPS